MKKLLIMMPELYHGGAEKQFRSLIQGIDKSKYSIYVIDEGMFDGSKEFNAQFMNSNPEVDFISLNGLHALNGKMLRWFSTILLMLKMVPIIFRIKPDIGIVYTTVDMKILPLLKVLKTTTVFSERNSGIYGPAFFRRNNMFYKSANHIICNSMLAYQHMSIKYPNVSYIPNGIDYHEMIKKKKNERFIIMIPARIARVKNQIIALKAIDILKDDSILLRIIGGVEDQDYYNELARFVRECKLEKNVEFVSYTDNIIVEYERCDLVILPSQSEGFSNVILESYMYGRECLLSRIEMNTSIASQNQRFFEIDDYKTLAQLIMEIMNLTDEEIQIECIQNHQYVVENFSMKTMLERYQYLLQEF